MSECDECGRESNDAMEAANARQAIRIAALEAENAALLEIVKGFADLPHIGFPQWVREKLCELMREADKAVKGIEIFEAWNAKRLTAREKGPA